MTILHDEKVGEFVERRSGLRGADPAELDKKIRIFLDNAGAKDGGMGYFYLVEIIKCQALKPLPKLADTIMSVAGRYNASYNSVRSTIHYALRDSEYRGYRQIVSDCLRYLREN